MAHGFGSYSIQHFFKSVIQVLFAFAVLSRQFYTIVNLLIRVYLINSVSDTMRNE